MYCRYSYSSFLLWQSLKSSLLQNLSIGEEHLFRSHHGAQNPANLTRRIEPRVIGALLHGKITCLERLFLAAVEGEDNLARQNAKIVEADSTMHGHAGLGFDVGDAEEHTCWRTAWESLSKVGSYVEVIDGDGVAAVKNGKCAALWPKRRVSGEGRIVGED